MDSRDYELRERLGEGGFGVVYRAFQPSLDREVAVKVVHPALAQQAGFGESFADEAKVVARVEHPNIVPLYAFGHDGDGAWLMMRLLRGGSLATTLERGPWNPEAAARLVQGIGGALEVAHRHGVVHRDVKPGNILLDQQGTAYLADFGIALDLFRTDVGSTAVGSPAYMSPEQLNSEPATEASDVYSLGLVMYEVVSGSRAWPSDDLVDTVRRQLNDPIPDLTTVRPDLPAGLAGVLRRATAKEPSARPSLSDFVDDFAAAALVGEAPVLTSPPLVGAQPVASGVFGRAEEIATVRDMLDESRLVTLTGVGGVGKTTLAGEVARLCADEFEDGAYVVELAAVTDPALIPGAIAGGLGMIEPTDGDTLDALANTLALRHSLLVLDNCEHLIEEASRVAQRLLSSAPRMRMVATSRELLGIAGEAAFPVPSLAVPSREDSDRLQLADYPAVQLFVERATAVQPSFELSQHNAEAVAGICRRLDGIPLAIELAAARVRVLTPEQISERLDDRFALLTGGRRTAMPRQRTLEAAIDWSYNLLSEEERLLFERMSVFVGGCTLEVAEEVCSGEGVEQGEVLDLIGLLVDKSLLSTTETSDTVRYGMLETIRQYAAARLLDRDGGVVWRDRHAELFEAMAHAGTAISTNSAYWRPRLTADRHNLTAALHWLYDTGQVARSGRMAADLWGFWLYTTGGSEAREWYSMLMAEDIEWEPEVFGTILHGAGSVTIDHNDGDEILERAVAYKQAHGLDASNSLNNLGDRLIRRGLYQEARPFIEEAVTAYPGNPGQYIEVGTLGEIAFQEGDDDDARRQFLLSAEIAKESGASEYSYTELNLSHLQRLAGDTAGARETITAYRLAHQGADIPRLDQQGNIAATEAALERDEGNYDRAEELVAEAAEALLLFGAWLNGLIALWATISVAAGRYERAACLFSAAEAGGAFPYLPMLRTSEIESNREQVKEALGVEAVERLTAEGAQMSINEAVVYAKSGRD